VKPIAVFVHLGKSPVTHLWKNLQRHKELFPDIEAYVILDQLVHVRKLPTGINLYFFKRENPFLQDSIFSAHDQKFRRGFWRFSLERLFALIEFHKEHPHRKILHIESDVLLLPNFPWDQLSNSKVLLWNNYNQARDVSALLYFPDYEMHQRFIEDVQSELAENPKHTDMTVLAALRDKGDAIYSLFPSLNPDLMDLMNLLNTSNVDLIEGNSSTREFKYGVFDGAAIGMWLTGHDPRNNYGKALIHDSSPLVSGDSLIDPRAIDYEMDEDGNLYLISRNTGNRISLWNLHVHSKSLELFSERWEVELRRYVVLAQSTAEIPFFKASALREMFIQSLKGRTFLRFVIGLPLVHKSRKWLSPTKQYILSRTAKNGDVRGK
jgi:hypothetical protein